MITDVLYFPSFQSRYVGYYEKVKYDLNEEMPPPKYLKIESVKITSIKGLCHRQ